MRQHDGGALLAESIIIDPGLSEAQQAGFQTGWQLAAATPTDELAESAINLVAEVMHGDRDGSTSSQLLGFLAYLQKLIQEISAEVPNVNAGGLVRRMNAVCRGGAG